MSNTTAADSDLPVNSVSDKPLNDPPPFGSNEVPSDNLVASELMASNIADAENASLPTDQSKQQELVGWQSSSALIVSSSNSKSRTAKSASANVSSKTEETLPEKGFDDDHASTPEDNHCATVKCNPVEGVKKDFNKEDICPPHAQPEDLPEHELEDLSSPVHSRGDISPTNLPPQAITPPPPALPHPDLFTTNENPRALSPLDIALKDLSPPELPPKDLSPPDLPLTGLSASVPPLNEFSPPDLRLTDLSPPQLPLTDLSPPSYLLQGAFQTFLAHQASEQAGEHDLPSPPPSYDPECVIDEDQLPSPPELYQNPSSAQVQFTHIYHSV